MKENSLLSRLFSIGLITVLLSGCYKDSSKGKCAGKREHEEKSLCKDLLGIGEGHLVQYPERLAPSFNPKTENELIFTESRFIASGDSFNSHLVHFNRNSATGITILDDVDRNNVAGYGPHNWVGMPSKTNGVDFVNVKTNSSFHWNWGGHHFTKLYWNEDGSKFCVLGEAMSFFELHLQVSWPELEVLDTLYGNIPSLQWAEGNQTYHYNNVINNRIDKVDMNTLDRIETIYNDEDLKTKYDYSLSSFYVNKNESFIYLVKNRLLKYDVSKQCEILLKDGCEQLGYYNPVLSPDETELLVVRFTPAVETESGFIHNRYDLYIMDIDGCNERPLIVE